MSDQNNYQQGYPNQGYPQMNPQQGYQQMNQQGYSQQGGAMYQQAGQVQDYQQVNAQQNYQQNYQQMNQQGYQQNYQQGYQQMNQQIYPQQNYQQPIGGGTKPPKGKKSKTGLIIGIVVAVVAIAIGLLLLVLKDSLFGNKIEGGYDTSDELIEGFWEGFDECDEDKINQCFYLEDDLSAESAEFNYENALAKQDSVDVDLDNIEITYDEYDIDDIPDLGVKVVDAKACHIEVPMTQEVEGYTYELIDIYDGYVYKLKNDKWYMGDIAETDVQIIDIIDGDATTDTIDYDTTEATTEIAIEDTTEVTTEATTEATISSGDEALYLGCGDLKAMGDSICGYVDVPSDWVMFQEIGGTGADYSYQMCSPDQSAIITMCAYDSDKSAYDAACGIYEGLAAEGNADEVVSAEATIGGYSAYQVYAVYGDEFLITYCFRAEDDRLHYVAVEMPSDLSNIALNVEGTFRFEE